LTWVKRYVRPNPNYREEAAHLPLLLAGLMLGASFLFGDGIISPTIRRSRPSAHRMDKLKVVSGVTLRFTGHRGC
jgi:hypothetical protein